MKSLFVLLIFILAAFNSYAQQYTQTQLDSLYEAANQINVTNIPRLYVGGKHTTAKGRLDIQAPGLLSVVLANKGLITSDNYTVECATNDTTNAYKYYLGGTRKNWVVLSTVEATGLLRAQSNDSLRVNFNVATPVAAGFKISILVSARYSNDASKGICQYYREFIVKNVSGSPLPVELVSFTAKAAVNGVVINWLTASEYKNDYFNVQRSLDGKQFVTFQKIYAKGASAYNAFDGTPFPNGTYYRLEQIDKDGAKAYSPVAYVKGNESDYLFVRGYDFDGYRVKIDLAETPTYYKLFDTTGKLVYQQRATGSIDSYVSGGVYVLVVLTQSGNEYRTKIFIAH